MISQGAGKKNVNVYYIIFLIRQQTQTTQVNTDTGFQ